MGQLILQAVVPVGSTATVHVPGRESAVRVGHGTHGWQVPDPVAPKSSLTIEATVRDVLDDQDVWRQIGDAVVDAGVAHDDAEAASRLAPYLDAPAADLIDAVTLFGVLPHSETLREQLAGLLPS